jgi:hypothetical protein
MEFHAFLEGKRNSQIVISNLDVLTNELNIKLRKRSAAASGLVVEIVSRPENLSDSARVTAPLFERLQELPETNNKKIVKTAEYRKIERFIFPPNIILIFRLAPLFALKSRLNGLC